MVDDRLFEKICIVCESIFQAKIIWGRTRDTCSENCRYELFRKRSERLCIECGLKFTVMQSSPKRLCSNSCRAKYVGHLKIGPNNHNWKEIKNIRPSNKKTLIKRIRARDKVCQDCSSTEKLHVHHIDSNPKNNADDNLILLCNKCHARRHEELGEAHLVPLILLAGKPKTLFDKICVVCQGTFPPKKHKQLTCSPDCGKILSGLSRRKYHQLSFLLEMEYPQICKGPSILPMPHQPQDLHIDYLDAHLAS